MNNQCVKRLKADDCQELTTFLNDVFSAHNGVEMDFAKKFPRIFVKKDENMSWYYAIRREGKICAVAASHPLDYRV